ncbi:NAD(P)-binding protein [Heliocybe sulcata]|uniref:NAD(P)-binding protein n=1 Tax=Heliocybe sulcata TaxID=5364 RepID=A0A5C3NA95_9AGAM|nr:NAD(P)-binding protein [Heliocybe sulcata]
MQDAIMIQQAGAPKLAVKADLTGKTVIIVGANTGIGLEAAKHFASMNPSKFILACRSEERGKRAVAQVEKATGLKNAELWLLDLSRFASVVAFADRFEKEGGRLDILVMNAGIAVQDYQEMEGWESTLHVNHLATALCSLLLLPRLLKTASEFGVQTRLVVVSSGVHYWTSITEPVRNSPNILKKLNEKESFPQGTTGRYQESKRTPTNISFVRRKANHTVVLNVLFVRALTAHLPPTSPLITTTSNPGLCDSELTRDFPGWTPPSIIHEGKKLALVSWTCEEGARQLVFAALAQVDGIRGAYTSENEIAEPSDFVISKEGKECEDRIWDETIEILSETTPKVTEIVKQYLTV